MTEIEELLIQHAELLEKTRLVVGNLDVKGKRQKSIKDNALCYYENRMKDCMDYLEFIRSNIKE